MSDYENHSPYDGEKDNHLNDHIERVRTTDTIPNLPADQFEKLYLNPENRVKGELRKTFGNPSPIALAGFLLANTPATIDLMGWRGAGGGSGNAAAGTATYMFLGGMLLTFGAIGEWILGNTFPAVVFFTFGGFWFSFGGTLMPFFAAISSYTPEGAPADAVDGFFNSFAFFLLFMAVLCFIYMICALRTNVILVFILFCFCFTFPLLSASYWYLTAGHVAYATNCRIAGGAFAFIASMAGWYLWTAQLFESVDFPISLPIFDLSTTFKGKTDRIKAREAAGRRDM